MLIESREPRAKRVLLKPFLFAVFTPLEFLFKNFVLKLSFLLVYQDIWRPDKVLDKHDSWELLVIDLVVFIRDHAFWHEKISVVVDL